MTITVWQMFYTILTLPHRKQYFFLSLAGTITCAFTISKLNCCEKKPGRDFSEAPTSACLQSWVMLTQGLHSLYKLPLTSNQIPGGVKNVGFSPQLLWKTPPHKSFSPLLRTCGHNRALQGCHPTNCIGSDCHERLLGVSPIWSAILGLLILQIQSKDIFLSFPFLLDRRAEGWGQLSHVVLWGGPRHRKAPPAMFYKLPKAR